jgi:hypothetical protein
VCYHQTTPLIVGRAERADRTVHPSGRVVESVRTSLRLSVPIREQSVIHVSHLQLNSSDSVRTLLLLRLTEAGRGLTEKTSGLLTLLRLLTEASTRRAESSRLSKHGDVSETLCSM